MSIQYPRVSRRQNLTMGLRRTMVSLAVMATLLIIAQVSAFAQTGTYAPLPAFTILNSSGTPVSGAKLCTYVSGTTTPVSTYTDIALTVANTNPVIADSAGRMTVILSPGSSYKFLALNPGSDTTCATGSTLWTRDNIAAVPSSSGNVDVLGTAGEALTAGQAAYLSDGSGSKTAGAWYKADATNTYSSTSPIIGMVPAAISASAIGSLRVLGQVTGLSSLTIGSTYYLSGTPGAITLTAPANSRTTGVADSTSSLVFTANPPAPSQKIATYTPTLTSVSNTAAETTALTFVIPANSMSDGDIIDVRYAVLAKNNKGSTGTATYRVNVGAGAQVILGAANFNNDAAEYMFFLEFHLMRVGAVVYVKGPALELNTDAAFSTQPILSVQAAGVITANASSTPANFTADQTVSLKITLSAADATFYVNRASSVSAKVTHTKG